jgi:hypothetical protein
MNTGDKLFLVFVSLVILFVVLLFSSMSLTTKSITITSHVDHIDYFNSYMNIHFTNGNSYRVGYPSLYDVVTDFDSSKNVTVKLYYSNLFWFTNTNDCWSISSIIKY